MVSRVIQLVIRHKFLAVVAGATGSRHYRAFSREARLCGLNQLSPPVDNPVKA